MALVRFSGASDGIDEGGDFCGFFGGGGGYSVDNFGYWCFDRMGLLGSQGGFAPGEPVHLTEEQAEALPWATSGEGKFARNLMKWNSDSLTNLECKKDVKRLGVTLEVAGRSATSGFCTIWVEPPKQRKFSRNYWSK